MAVPFLEQLLKRVFGGGSLISATNPLPTMAEARTGTPIAKVGYYSGTSTSWQTLAEWTVATGKTGDLHEVSWNSSNDSKTRVKLTIAGTDQGIPNQPIDSPLSLPWGDNSIAAGQKVTLEVKSSDGTSITVSGAITGTER